MKTILKSTNNLLQSKNKNYDDCHNRLCYQIKKINDFDYDYD